MNPTGTSVPIPSFVYTVFLFKKDDMQGRSKAYGTVQDICISKPDIAIYLFHVMVTRIPKRILYALWKNGKSLAVFTPPHSLKPHCISRCYLKTQEEVW